MRIKSRTITRLNTYTTYDDKLKREDFSDIISMISPEEVPFFSMLDSVKAESTKHEWSTDSLATPAANAAIEGDAYSYSAITATSRVGNYLQISKKEYIITETQEAINKAGVKSEVGRQRAKKGVELKTDIEVEMLSNNASVAGNSTTARKSGGFRAWLSSNDDMGTGGASGGYNSGTGVVDAATNGTQRAFTKTLLDNTIETTYKAGGNPKVLMVSPYVKRVFSTFMSDSNVAAFRAAQSGEKQGTIYGAADAYVSDFGVIDVVPNRQLARIGATHARNAFLIDQDKVKIGWLRKIQEDKDVAKTSDALPRVLKCEWTLVVTNQAAHGVVADLFGMTAST